MYKQYVGISGIPLIFLQNSNRITRNSLSDTVSYQTDKSRASALMFCRLMPLTKQGDEFVHAVA